MPRRNYKQVLLAVVVLVVGIAALLYLPAFLARHRQHSANPRAVATSGREFPVTLTDVMGVETTITAPPKKIVSLSPNVTEILFAIGAGERVIADTTYCDYPPAAAKLPKIGGYLDPNVEKVAALAPDLVLGCRGTRRDIFKNINSLGIPVVVMDPETMAEVADSVRLIGRVVGENANAEKLATELETRRQAVLARTMEIPDAKRPRVLFLFTVDGYYSAGPGSHIDNLITEAGGRNIAARTKTAWPQLSLETIIADDPQVILLLTGKSMASPLTADQALKRIAADKRWRGVSAIKNRRIVMLDEDIITIPGPRMAEALEQIALGLHPDKFVYSVAPTSARSGPHPSPPPLVPRRGGR